MATGYSENGPEGSFVEIKSNEIKRLEKIDSGSFGQVYKAIWRGTLVAVKYIEIYNATGINMFRNEQLSRVSHENIVTLYGACTEKFSDFLVMEYSDIGSLYNRLHNTRVAYTTADAIIWALQCAEAVDYMHSMKPKPLIHRDLKTRNSLLFNEGKVLKICDFGTVRDKEAIMTKFKGSVASMAPEVFDSNKYSEKCDVHSFAIILWEIIHRKEPFSDMVCQQILKAVRSGDRPPIDAHCPKSIKDLITKCWDPSPENRPTMKAVVEQLLNVNSDEPLPPQGQFVGNREEANPSDEVAAMPPQPPHSTDVVNEEVTQVSTVENVCPCTTQFCGPIRCFLRVLFCCCWRHF